jgi:hypothetical protein
MRGDTFSEDHFDMLPFIGILMCLLASLLLITMSIASINIGPGAGEGWIPTANDTDTRRTPLLVEWDGSTATIQYPGRNKRISLGKEVKEWWDSDWDLKNRDMLAFIKEMEGRKDTHYVLFAVRPSGFDNFQALVSQFRQKKIGVGFEPIEQTKPVRLRLPGRVQP